MSSALPSEDVAFLEKMGAAYETLPHDSVTHLVIHKFPINHSVYDVAEADLLIEIPAGYPTSKLDMFWTNPIIKFLNGAVPQATETTAEYHGRTWQRWSRHPESWRPNVDNLRSFFGPIKAELQGVR